MSWSTEKMCKGESEDNGRGIDLILIVLNKVGCQKPLMPLSAASTGGQLPNGRGNGAGEWCALCKTDDLLCLVESQFLASGCVGRWERPGHLLSDRASWRRGGERVLLVVNCNSWRWKVHELCCCLGGTLASPENALFLAQGMVVGYYQSQHAAGCFDGSLVKSP